MVKCDICGKDFKNTQGLRGHKYFTHFETKDTDQHPLAQPATLQPLSDKSEARPAAQDRLSKLEERLARLEHATGVRERTEIEKMLGINEHTLAERVAELAGQLRALKADAASHAELSSIADQLTGLTQKSASLELQCSYLQDKIGVLNMGLSVKADTELTSTLDEKILRLETKQAEILKSLAELRDSQEKIHGHMAKFIVALTKQLNEVLNPICEQLREQKQVTDWARKKFELRPSKN